MKAVQFSRFGVAPEVAELVEIPDPGPPGPGEVLVDILAVPINPANLMAFEGQYGIAPPALPARMGGEAVGRVAELGAGVSHLRVGDRVLALLAGRTNWCEKIKVSAAALQPLPEAADTLQLAMMAVNPATAWLMLKTITPLKAGEWVIQNAGNSSVGRCIIALAQQMGVRTISLVRRPDQADLLRAGGGDLVLVDGPDLADAVKRGTHGAEIRLALDALAGEASDRLARHLAPGGTIVTYGRLAGRTCVVDAAEFIFRSIVHRGFWLGHWLEAVRPDERTAMYGEIARLVVAGVIRVEVEATYPLARVKDALAHAARPGRSGKILLVPNP